MGNCQSNLQVPTDEMISQTQLLLILYRVSWSVFNLLYIIIVFIGYKVCNENIIKSSR